VPIYNLMEDAATAEISRSQVWQWVRHGARLSDGRVVTEQLVRQIMAELFPTKSLAIELFERLMTGAEFAEFLTLVAYEHLD
jgi:malate synthase